MENIKKYCSSSKDAKSVLANKFGIEDNNGKKRHQCTHIYLNNITITRTISSYIQDYM